MDAISKITIPNGTQYEIKDANAARRDITTYRNVPAPIASKTYTDVIATADTQPGAGFFYLRVRGTTFKTVWHVKVNVVASVPGQDDYHAASEEELYGRTNGIVTSEQKNGIGLKKPVYYHSVFLASELGYNNDCWHYIGFSLMYSDNPTNANYKRTITVELLEYDNCEAEMLDTLVTPDDIPNRSAHTNWYTSTRTSYSDYNLSGNSFYHTGIPSSLINLYDAYGNYVADSVVYRYQLLFQTDENTLTPLNNVSNTVATTKTMLTDVEFDPLGRIIYYSSSTTINAGGIISYGSRYYSYSQIDARYTFNCGTTLVVNEPFYLVVDLQSNGMVKLASSAPWAQALPSVNDGHLYIFIGRASSDHHVGLYPDHPVYYHDGTRIRRFYGIEDASEEVKPVKTQNAISIPFELPVSIWTGSSGNYTATISSALIESSSVALTPNITSGFEYLPAKWSWTQVSGGVTFTVPDIPEGTISGTIPVIDPVNGLVAFSIPVSAWTGSSGNYTATINSSAIISNSMALTPNITSGFEYLPAKWSWTQVSGGVTFTVPDIPEGTISGTIPVIDSVTGMAKKLPNIAYTSVTATNQADFEAGLTAAFNDMDINEIRTIAVYPNYSGSITGNSYGIGFFSKVSANVWYLFIQSASGSHAGYYASNAWHWL